MAAASRVAAVTGLTTALAKTGLIALAAALSACSQAPPLQLPDVPASTHWREAAPGGPAEPAQFAGGQRVAVRQPCVPAVLE